MPRRCVVMGCPAREAPISKTFYRFPSDETLCRKWIKSLCSMELVRLYEKKGFSYLNKTKFVCSDHFDAKQMRNVRAPSQGLFEGAVPTVSLNLNMDTLISSLNETEMLDEIFLPKPLPKKQLKRPRVIQSIENREKSVENRKLSIEIDVKRVKASTDDISEATSKMSMDDIPLRKLFGDNIKIEKKEDFKEVKSKKASKQCKKRKRESKMNDKKSKNRINQIEEVFLPSPTIDVIKFSKVKKIGKVKKKKKMIREMDPLECMSGRAVKLHKNIKVKKKKIVHRKSNKIKKKKAVSKISKKIVKVVLASNNVNTADLNAMLPTDGPKKIIKIVVPPKNTADNESSPKQNKIIKVVVPKTSLNGREINLEKSEISKILKLISHSKNVNGKNSTAVTRNLDVNKILKQLSGPNKVLCDKNNTIGKGRLCEIQEVKNTNAINRSYCESGKTFNLITGCKEISVTLESGSSKILKKVPPPFNTKGKQIKLLTSNLAQSKIINKVSVTENTNETDNNVETNNSKTIALNESDDEIELIDHCNESIDVDEEDNEQRNDYSKEVLTKSQNTDISKETKKDIIVSSVETNPVAEELRKRIKDVIGKRFGDDDSSSDDETLSIVKKKCNFEKINNKSVKLKNDQKVCKCDSKIKNKLMKLWKEERELKRRLLSTQNFATKYKVNNRKMAVAVEELRKQVPEKKPPRIVGQTIKTIVPLSKIKNRNPRKYRFTKNFKTFALDLFYSSPLSYGNLEKEYFLPSRKTLKNWLVHPKNLSNEMLALKNAQENTQPIVETPQIRIQTLEPIHSSQDILDHHDNMDPYDRNIGGIETYNIEPLQENIDEIMFRNDLTAAIMNT